MTIKAVEVRARGKPITLTAETMEATFQWYADNCRECAKQASEGAFWVNDLDEYVKYCERDALAFERQKKDGPDGRYSLAFLQQALYIQTGESVPLFSR